MKQLLTGLLLLASISSFAKIGLTETFEVNISALQNDFTPSYLLHLTTVAEQKEYMIQCQSDGDNSNFSEVSDYNNPNEIKTGFFFDSEEDCLYAINAMKKMNKILKYEKFGIEVDSVKSKFLKVNARR